MRIPAFAFASMVCLVSQAYNWVDFDATNWPTSGDVRIPANTTVTVDDAHVEAFAGWSNIYFYNTTSKIVFSNVNKTAYFNASVAYGNGQISATDCPGLVITSDNSKLGAAGAFSFVNSRVVVSNEFGLGSASSGRTTVNFTAAGTLGALQFGLPDGQAFTNHVQLLYLGESGCTTMSIGSSSSTEYFVQDGDFLIEAAAANKKLYFKNNFEQISGYFGYRTAAQPLYTYGTTGSKATFSGSTRIIVGANSADGARNSWVLMNGGEYHFANAEGGFHLGQLSPHSGAVVHFDVPNVFKSYFPGNATGLALYAPYAVEQNSTYWNDFDLHGNDLSFSHFGAGNAPQGQEGSVRYYYFDNDGEAATVSLVGDSSGQTYYAAWSAPVEFRGKTSLTVDNKAHNKFGTRVSKTVGALTVKTGSTAEYVWNGGWAGTNAVVESGATLIANSAKAFGEASTVLEVAEGGKFVIKTGAVAKFSGVYLAGEMVIPGSYTVAELKANPKTAAFFDGDDAATLTITAPAWSGWPTEEGATVYIPAGSSQYCREADVENVAKAAKIYVLKNARLLFTNGSTPVTVKADIAGPGLVKIYQSAGVTLTGNNAELTGGFQIDDSTVTVRNDYGLGGPNSVAATINLVTGHSRGRLSFVPADGKDVISNHVGLVYTIPEVSNGAHSETYPPMLLGSTAPDTYFVQDGDVLLNNPNNRRFIYITNNYEQVSGTFGCGAFEGALYVYPKGVASETTVKFSGTTRLCNGLEASPYTTNDIYLYGGNYRFGNSGGANVGSLTVHVPTYVHFDIDDAFRPYLDPTLTGRAYGVYALQPYTADQVSYFNSFDLHGHSLKVCAFLDRSVGNKDKYFYLRTEDEKPCTVTLVGDKAGSTYASSCEFRGPISVVVDNGAVNSFTSRVSRTEGTLTVKTGTASFANDGAWCGTNAVVKTGATLAVAAAAAPKMFVAANGSPRTALTLEADSTLSLAGGTTKALSCFANGEQQGRGTYGAAGSVAPVKELANISGSGLLWVQKGLPRGLMIFVR